MSVFWKLDLCITLKICELNFYTNFFRCCRKEMEDTSSAVTLYSDFSKCLSKTLTFLFRLAWLSRIRLPAYLTLIFLATDIRLSVEIVIGDHGVLDLDDDEDDDDV